MKKNILSIVALSAFLAMNASNAQAQRSYDCPPLSPEYEALAAQVISLNMEDPDKANKVYMSLAKKIKGNKESLVSVGTYFLDNNNYPAANYCAKAVYELAPTYIPGLMFSAEVFMKAKKWGEAGGRFDEVLAIQPDNIAALKRNAFVYKNVNPHAAIDYLGRIKEADPTYIDVDKDMGDIYYKLGEYDKAISHYDTYYNAAPKEAGKIDIAACESYLQSLFSMSAKDETNLDKIIAIADVIKPLAPNDILIPRMEFFAKYGKIETAMDYDGALKAADDASAYIRNKQFADSVYMYLDYDYVGKLEKEKGNIGEAITYYEMALSSLEAKSGDITDEKKKEDNLNKRGSYYYEISVLYRRNKDAEKCIAMFRKYLDLLGEKADLSDKFTLGTNYAAASQMQSVPEEKKAEYHKMAIDTFKEITTSETTNHLPIVMSYVQLARLTNTDNQTPLDEVHDYYIKALTEAEDAAIKEKAAGARFEAARYLFFYYVTNPKVNKAEATKYANLLNDIRPDDDFTKMAVAHVKTM